MSRATKKAAAGYRKRQQRRRFKAAGFFAAGPLPKFILSYGARAVMALLLFAGMPETAFAVVRYVNQSAVGGNDGTSWGDAYRELQSALQSAQSGDEIWVTSGTYYPDYVAATNSHDGNRDRRFVLKKGVRVFGGFNGTESSRFQRNWVENPVILSGDIGERNNFSDNTRTILQIPGGGPNTLIEGVVFLLGNANNPLELGNGDAGGSGGAIHAVGDFQLRFCTFIGNHAVYGGAIYASYGKGEIINCLFYGNEAVYVGGAFRVGIGGDLAPGSMVLNSTIIGNKGSRGGAFTAGQASIVKNNVVWGNTGSPGWELVEVYIQSTVSGNFLQIAMNPYPSGGIVADPYIVSMPSPGDDQAWGTADDDYYGAGISSISPARHVVEPSDLPRDTTDLDGDGDENEPIPWDIQRQTRVLDGKAEAGALELWNEAPSAILLAPSAIRENLPPGSRVGVLSTKDPNAGTFTYELVTGEGDDHNALVMLDGHELRTIAVLDYEAMSHLTLRLKTTDSLGASLEQVLRVDIIDAIDQVVGVQALKPHASWPTGGIPPISPGILPDYFGEVVITRQGQIDRTLMLQLRLEGSAVRGDDYLSTLGQGGFVTFAPEQSSIRHTVQPLLRQPGNLAARTVSFVINPGANSYDIDLSAASATVTIHPSPSHAWLAQDPENSLDPSKLLSRLFPSGASFKPLAGLTSHPRLENRFMLMAARNTSARDVSAVFEASTDLVRWQPAIPETVVQIEGMDAYCFPMDMGSRFFRVSAQVSDRPENFTVPAGPGIRMIGLPAGRIILGEAGEVRSNVLNAQLTQPFWIGQTEITQAQYLAVMGVNPSTLTRDSLPVLGISWHEAKEFVKRLTEAEVGMGRLPSGYVYRLPTEAEWEYASAAGTETPVWTGSGRTINDYAWHQENSFSVPHSVAAKLPNAWGLHDMYGNMAEWVYDWSGPATMGLRNNPAGPADGVFKVAKGGHIQLPSSSQNSWWKAAIEPETKSPVLGFRIVYAPGLPQGL